MLAFIRPSASPLRFHVKTHLVVYLLFNQYHKLIFLAFDELIGIMLGQYLWKFTQGYAKNEELILSVHRFSV
jgi:hypothetical protein